jgi:hypothetical protein
MKTNEILEGNKLIAKFMGTLYHQDEKITATIVKYHSSWDWLMPVVEKIKDIDNQADIETAKILEFFKDDEDVNIFHTSIFCHLQEVYNRVVVFIKWYNEKYAN